jgi:hypothetical protein
MSCSARRYSDSCSRSCAPSCRTCVPACSCSVTASVGTLLTDLTLTGAGASAAINSSPLTLNVPCTSNVTVTFSGSLWGTTSSADQILGVQLSVTNSLSLYTPLTTVEGVCPRAFVATENPIPISITTVFTLVPGSYAFTALLFNEEDTGVTGTYSVNGNLTVVAVKTSNTVV